MYFKREMSHSDKGLVSEDRIIPRFHWLIKGEVQDVGLSEDKMWHASLTKISPLYNIILTTAIFSYWEQ